MAGNEKKLIISSFTVKLGCGSCRRSRRLLSDIFHPKPKHNNNTPTSYSSSTINLSPATLYSNDDNDADSGIKGLRAVQGFGRIGGESLAVEKDSDDPYLDFRHSMLQMILENEIYSKEDLKELLHCFLRLNSPHHHGIIVRAFTEIWNGVYSVKSSTSSKMHGVYKSRDLLLMNVPP